MSKETSAQERTLADALIELYLAMDRVYAEASRDVDLTPQQAHLLCATEWLEPKLGDLAETLGCDKTNVTGLVDRAARRGLVERSPDEEDRRVTRLTLTDRGREFVVHFHEALDTRLAGLEGDVEFTARDLDRLLTAISDDSSNR